uniref:P-type ATPase C-terminal domain-containing protein n=1 Tax=Sphenodon punctatus TaxID=8508 RepID=A0A8D0HNG9_SPHPU
MTVMVGSILFYFVFVLAFGATCKTCNPPSNPYWNMEKHMSDPVFYLVCILTTCVALLPRYLLRVLQGSLFLFPLMRAKHLERLTPKEQHEAIKQWKDSRSSPAEDAAFVKESDADASYVFPKNLGGSLEQEAACTSDTLDEPEGNSNVNCQEAAFLSSSREPCSEILAAQNFSGGLPEFAFKG